MNLETLFAALVPAFMILGMWIDAKRDSRKKHEENIQRFATIETKIDPLWKWFIAEGRDSE